MSPLPSLVPDLSLSPGPNTRWIHQRSRVGGVLGTRAERPDGMAEAEQPCSWPVSASTSSIEWQGGHSSPGGCEHSGLGFLSLWPGVLPCPLCPGQGPFIATISVFLVAHFTPFTSTPTALGAGELASV